jgi:hypothetical protein
MADDFTKDTEVVPAGVRYTNIRKSKRFMPSTGNVFTVTYLECDPGDADAVNALLSQAKALCINSKQLNGTADPEDGKQTLVDVRVVVRPDIEV